ncbi:hypothetical protein FB451DRAFT_642339 [Mycena latifolia]|nr:hypothetical protein FB451DRAFT_642339 [Mycena latifolia]
MSGTGPPTGAFAANEDEAESGRRVPSLPRSKTMEKEKPDMGASLWPHRGALGSIDEDDSPSTAEDGPFSQYCTDNAPIWKLYMDQAKISDDNLANIFNSDLDPLLIFAGLFSAILSAFLIEIRKGLQEDLQNITNNLLLILIENQHNVTGPQVPSSAHFEPTSSSRWINGLWFSSLMFSLMSALGASLAKGWVTQFSSSVSGSSWGDAALHCRRFRGLKRWHLKLIVQCLPILIHIAFFLFSIGLVILVFQDDTAIGIAILILTALILGLYIASSVHSVHSVDSPFRTPLSGMIRRLFNGPWRLEAFTAFPEQQETQKAQALAWLLAESQNGDTITAAIRAIAGLPATPIVQDELLRPASVGLLSRTLSSELAKPASDPETSRSCLYAIIHLVQTGPADAEDTISLGILGDLIDSGGPLAITDSLPAGIREIALCIKARIWLLIWGNAPDTILFDTELPVLLKACEPGHLRRLLFQVRLLASRPGNTPAMSALCPSSDDFCAILRDGNAVNRNQVHAELVKTAASGTDLTDSGIKFGARTLLEGMTTGSTELRRCYAELFSDLATDAAFRNTIKHSGVETEICSLLQTEDDHVRKHVVVALGIFASDDYTRIVITTGLRATINSMLVEDVPVFWAIARFLADVARHDDIRTNVVNSGLLNSIMSRTDPEDEKGFKIAVGVVGELGEYEDIRAASTAAAIIDFWLNIRSAAGMQGLVALAKHNDVLQTIATPQNTERIINVLNSLEWRMSIRINGLNFPRTPLSGQFSCRRYWIKSSRCSGIKTRMYSKRQSRLLSFLLRTPASGTGSYRQGVAKESSRC